MKDRGNALGFAGSQWVMAVCVGCMGCMLLLLGAASPEMPAGAGTSMPPAGGTALQQQVNETFGLSESQLITIDVDRQPGVPVLAAVVIDGQPMILDLQPHSVRSPLYELRAQLADGSIVSVDPGPERSLRGTVLGHDGSGVAGSMLEDGLHALVRFADGDRVWIEPVATRVAGAAANQYVVYRSEHVISQGGTCGVTEQWMRQHPPVEAQEANDEGPEGTTLYCVDLACDADVEYYIARGSNVLNVQNQINLVINTVNLQYEAEVDIRHVITNILVRTAEPDPYSSTNPSTLLGQFQNHWNSSQGSVVRDVAHLFTGKNLDGTVIGIASLSVICTSSGYSLVQSDCCGGLSCAADLSSHELGHNWSAQHCSCTGNTMNPSITCANVHAAISISQIVNHRNSRTCIGPCEDGFTTLPFSDTFPSTTIDGAKWTGISGAVASTVGQNEPSAPNALNLDGSPQGGDQLRSAKIDCSDLTSLTLNFQYQRRGGGDSPESGDDLVTEYFNSSGAWIEVNRQLGSGADMTTFAPVVVNMPSGAFHGQFRFRFRAISGSDNTDDWFIDDVGLVGVAPPFNNACVNAPVTLAGNVAFTTMGATTDGPDEPAACTFNGSSQIGNDVWFRFPAQCTGTATIGVCGADYDAKLAVYGNLCPSSPGTTLACADNSCGDDPQVTIAVVTGSVYRIRVGGFNGATGSGTLSIVCTPDAAPCPADITGNNQVDVDDLLSVINNWGAVGANPSDITGDNQVNVDDLLAVINGWGACPN